MPKFEWEVIDGKLLNLQKCSTSYTYSMHTFHNYSIYKVLEQDYFT